MVGIGSSEPPRWQGHDSLNEIVISVFIDIDYHWPMTEPEGFRTSMILKNRSLNAYLGRNQGRRLQQRLSFMVGIGSSEPPRWQGHDSLYKIVISVFIDIDYHWPMTEPEGFRTSMILRNRSLNANLGSSVSSRIFCCLVLGAPSSSDWLKSSIESTWMKMALSFSDTMRESWRT